MARLRHVALYAEDIEATACFYEKTFELKRVLQREHVITLSDGVVSLAIADMSRSPHGRKGLDHIGFQVDDMASATATLEALGSAHCGQISRTRADPGIERKYSDPNGLVFDIVTAEHAGPVWGLDRAG
jgi:catechol 2,3-dioxygenase-like lactoylglutathione lyase family enzyme